VLSSLVSQALMSKAFSICVADETSGGGGGVGGGGGGGGRLGAISMLAITKITSTAITPTPLRVLSHLACSTCVLMVNVDKHFRSN
jgi:hypothetical protein